MTLSLLVMARNSAGIKEFLDLNAGSLDQIDELRLVITTDARFGGQSLLSNRFKASALGQVCGIVHADTTFPVGSLPVFMKTALEGKVVGIVGAREGPPDMTPQEKNVWSNSVSQETPVSTIDCCSIFFRRDIPLSFDEMRFPSWHCVNEDFCLQAHAAGIPVVIPSANASHAGQSTFQPAWQSEYWAYRQFLAGKWPNAVFNTT
jgi:hypothetical protein